MRTNRVGIGLALAAIGLIGYLLYRSLFGNDWNVTPDAAEAIEKAKRR